VIKLDSLLTALHQRIWVMKFQSEQELTGMYFFDVRRKKVISWFFLPDEPILYKKIRSCQELFSIFFDKYYSEKSPHSEAIVFPFSTISVETSGFLRL